MNRIIVVVLITCVIHTTAPNCRCDTPCLRPEPGPAFAYDFTKPFHEKRYWIEQNSRSVAWQICWQRLGINLAFFEPTTMFCFPAEEVPAPTQVPRGSRCWRGDGVMVCEDPNGRITVAHARPVKK